MKLNVVELVESQMTGKSNQCQTCRWIESRDKDEQASWDQVMADPKKWPHSAIHRAILRVTKAGEPKPGRGSIENHRAGAHRRS